MKNRIYHHNQKNRINYAHCRRGTDIRRSRFRRLLLLISISIFVSCAALFGSVFASAHNFSRDTGIKYYKCIEVSSGETLWAIADRYVSSEYNSHQEYIEEVIQINQMNSFTLYADQKLIVPYYNNPEKEDTYTVSADDPSVF